MENQDSFKELISSNRCFSIRIRDPNPDHMLK